MPFLEHETQGGSAATHRSRASSGDSDLLKARVRHRIGLFGHFGDINFGNESTLQSLLYHLRRFAPSSEITCICTDTAATRRVYNVRAVPMNGIVLKPLWLRSNAFARFVRRLVIGMPSELHRWLQAFGTLRRMDVLIVAGTGLLTDISGLLNWGPYNVFKWAVIAKLCRCKLVFVSVGAGPVYGTVGRHLIKAALRLADFRSYRDEATKRFLEDLGFRTGHDRVYPDLAFSLPKTVMPTDEIAGGPRPVVGLGLMLYAGRQSVDRPSETIYAEYLECLVAFVRWLLSHDYDVRLLTGDICDRPAVREFVGLLREEVDSL